MDGGCIVVNAVMDIFLYGSTAVEQNMFGPVGYAPIDQLNEATIVAGLIGCGFADL